MPYTVRFIQLFLQIKSQFTCALSVESHTKLCMSDAALEELRARHSLSKGRPAAPTKNPSRSRGLASAPGSSSSENIGLTAVESVHSGLVASLEADCRNYREKINLLQEMVKRLEAKLAARPPPEEPKAAKAQLAKLTDEMAALRSEREEDARRLVEEREAAQRVAAELAQARWASRLTAVLVPHLRPRHDLATSASTTATTSPPPMDPPSRRHRTSSQAQRQAKQAKAAKQEAEEQAEAEREAARAAALGLQKEREAWRAERDALRARADGAAGQEQHAVTALEQQPAERVPSALLEDGAPSASRDHPKARGSPALPVAPPQPRRGLRSSTPLVPTSRLRGSFRLAPIRSSSWRRLGRRRPRRRRRRPSDSRRTALRPRSCGGQSRSSEDSWRRLTRPRATRRPPPRRRRLPRRRGRGRRGRGRRSERRRGCAASSRRRAICFPRLRPLPAYVSTATLHRSAQARADAARAEAERAALAKKAAGAGRKAQGASHDAQALKEQLSAAATQLKELKAQLARQQVSVLDPKLEHHPQPAPHNPSPRPPRPAQEAEASLEQQATREAHRAQHRIEKLERQASADAAALADAQARLQAAEEERHRLEQQLDAGVPPPPPPPPPQIARASSEAHLPMSNSNFAKMMSMQQEINQLKAHIEGLTRGMAAGTRKGRVPG